MISVQRRPQLPSIDSPLQYQALQLRCLDGVFQGNAFEDADLIGDHPHRIDDFARVADGKIAGERSAADNDALVGFVWGHAMTIVGPACGVKDRRP